jgi:hypothetical protein
LYNIIFTLDISGAQLCACDSTVLLCGAEFKPKSKKVVVTTPQLEVVDVLYNGVSVIVTERVSGKIDLLAYNRNMI